MKFGQTDSSSTVVVESLRTLYLPSYTFAPTDVCIPASWQYSHGRRPEAVVFKVTVIMLFVLTILCIENQRTHGRRLEPFTTPIIPHHEDVVLAVPITIVNWVGETIDAMAV